VPEAQGDEAEGLGVEVVRLATVRDAIDRTLGEKVAIPRAAAAGAVRA
jgi:hypothetical protein